MEEVKMRDIKTIRKEIDNIDKEIAKLFEMRMNLVKDVIEYKISNNLPILDSSRENEVINKNIDFVDDEYKKYYQEFIKNMLNISKEFQKDYSKK